MASPIGGMNQGNADQEFKARVISWIRDEIHAAATGGIGLHVDGATGDLVADRGQFRSMNYVHGSAGWTLTPAGDQELHGSTIIGGSTTIDGTLIVSGTDLPAALATLATTVTFLSGQSSGYTSTKVWYLSTDTSGTGAYELLAYDSTYDDEYTFQASSTGVLKIEISADVMLNNGSATVGGATSRGYSLSWSGGSLAWDVRRSARVGGVNCGAISVAASSTDIVTVPGNATVTLQTCRARWSPVAPDTTWHRTRDTTVVVTRVGI